MTERWKPVVGFPNYEVSDQGRVRSNVPWGPRGTVAKTRILSQTTDARGYRRVKFNLNGKRYTQTTHRTVLEAFVGPCPEGMQCRHLDGNPSNNALDNLAWGTPTENMRDALRHDTILRRERHPKSKLSPEEVKALQDEYHPGMKHKDLAEKYGVSRSTITKHLSGKTWVENPEADEDDD